MECNHARLLLVLTPPHGSELEPSEAAALEQHLAECSECGTLAHTEREVDERLGQAMRQVRTPDGLRERLLNKLSHQYHLRRRRVLVRAAAMAAAILLTVGSGYWWISSQRIEVDVAQLGANQPFTAPEGVESYFRSRGVEMAAPRDFDYTCLDSCELVDFQGVQVPHLLFAYKDAGKKGFVITHAHVYVLSDRQFDLHKVTEDSLPQRSGRTMRLSKPADNSHYLFVVVEAIRENVQ